MKLKSSARLIASINILLTILFLKRHSFPQKYRKFVRYGLFLFSFLAFVFLAHFAYYSFAKKDITIATGSAEGFYYKIATGIKDAMELSGKYNVKLIYTKGSKHNLELLNKGEVDIAIIQGDIIPQKDVRLIAQLFPETLHLVVRKDSGINTFEEAINSRICIGSDGTGMSDTNKIILEHFKVDLSSKNICTKNFSETINGLIDGSEKAALFFTGLYSDGLARLLNSGQVKYISLDAQIGEGGNINSIMSKFPFYKPYVIPKNLYGHYPEEPVNSIYAAAVLVSKDSYDKAIIKDLAKYIDDSRIRISTISKTALLPPLQILDVATFPMPAHDGTVEYIHRDSPGFIERNSGTLSLIFSVIAGVFSVIFASSKNPDEFQHDKIIFFINDIKSIYANIDKASLNSLIEYRNKVIDIKKFLLNDIAKGGNMANDGNYAHLQNEIHHLLIILNSVIELRKV